MSKADSDQDGRRNILDGGPCGEIKRIQTGEIYLPANGLGATFPVYHTFDLLIAKITPTRRSEKLEVELKRIGKNEVARLSGSVASLRRDTLELHA